jgi:hypothetical protein
VILQPGSEEDQREDQRKTVGLDPQRIVQPFGLGRQPQLVLDAALGGGDESMPRMSSSGQRVFIESENSTMVWSRRWLMLGNLVADDAEEALAHFRLHVRVVDQVGHRRADIAERRPAAFGQRVQHLVAARLLLDAARDVLDGQHVAGHPVAALAR